jgi:hypothetical protein
MPDLEYSQFLELIDELIDDEPDDSRAAFMSILRDRIQTDPIAKDAFVAWAWEQLRSQILAAAVRGAQERVLGHAMEHRRNSSVLD